MKHVQHHIVAATDTRPLGLSSRPPSRIRDYAEALVGLVFIFGVAYAAWVATP